MWRRFYLFMSFFLLSDDEGGSLVMPDAFSVPK